MSEDNRYGWGGCKHSFDRNLCPLKFQLSSRKPLCVFCLWSYQRKVIQWLLNHDPALRPTTQELLKSELLPPPQMEESELHEVLQHTMANVNGKAYRTMVGQLFAQNTSPVMDYTYDIDIHKVWVLT